MRSSIFALGSALALAPFALGQIGEDLAIQNQVVAGQDTQGTLSAAAVNDGEFDTYRVYLATTPPGWGTGPVCTLVNSSSTKDSTITVNIPASVGPSGDFYSLSFVLFNSNATGDNASMSGFDYSNTFELTGATGNWSQYELSGNEIGSPDDIPCSSYDCARQCSQKYYPANTGDDDTAANNTFNCILKCPGVTDTEDDTSGAAAKSGAVVTSAVSQTSTASTGSRSGSATVSSSTSGSATKTTGSATTSATGSSTGSASAASASKSGAAVRLHLNMEIAVAAGALGVAGIVLV